MRIKQRAINNADNLNAGLLPTGAVSAPSIMALVILALPLLVTQLLAPHLCADEPRKQAASLKAYTEPKTCFVHATKAIVRCGPGSQFYQTSVLEQGAAVDVYVETPDGWSGIRPPDGSHNWIPSNSAYLLPGGKSAEVTVDQVAAFVGSDSSDIESLLFQTELVRSQKVAVLGEAQREEGANKSLWFRISPPPGEFRWLRSSQLRTDPVAKPKPAYKPETNTKPKSEVQLASQEDSNQDPEADSVQRASGTRGAKVANSEIDEVAFESGEEIIDGQQVMGDGKIVWSDEAEQVARIEQEIQREQAELAGEESVPVQPTHAAPLTVHEQDQAYWNTLHGTQGRNLKVGPVGGILGWFGFSIVEEDPVHLHPAASSHHRAIHGGGAFSRRNPSGAHSPLIDSRLDRLPRPSRRYNDGSLWSMIKSQGPLFGEDTPDEPLLEEDSFSSEPSRPLDRVPVATASFPRAVEDPSRGSLQSPPLSGTPDRFQTPAIQDAFVQLTAMVTKPTEQWNLEPFRVSAKSWIELGETPLIRGEARLLLDRIEEFESLRSRSLTLQSPPLQTPPLQTQALRSPPPLNTPPLTEAVPARVAGSGSEASGWLQSVHTSLPGQPEFALTDDAGKVLAYVRPTTGLNLRRYVQQPVTIYGTPGYIPNLAARQIVAERVVRLR